MKKIVFLLALVLVFASCDNGSTDYSYTQQSVFFSGTTSGDNPFTITGSNEEIIYTTSSTSESFMFSLTKSGEVNAIMGRTAGKYSTEMWDALSITTNTNTSGYDIRNISKSIDDTGSLYTFSMSGDYTSSMQDLTTNTTAIQINFTGGSENDKMYELTDKFIAAIKNYFQ